MEYIISGMGRSGSTLVTRLISRALGRDHLFARAEGQPLVNTVFVHLHEPHGDGEVIKTHAHFTREFSYPYRTVYVYGKVSDIIASLYGPGVFFFKDHFTHLEVEPRHSRMFLWLMRSNIPFHKFLAFAYLVAGDKCRFKENFQSWKRSKHTLFVHYDDLCFDKDATLAKMESHLEIKLGKLEIKPRATSRNDLPLILRVLIKLCYGKWA